MMHIPLSFPEIEYKNWSFQNFEMDGISYQKLEHNGIVKMMNTPEIVVDFEDFLNQAEGHVLINGLGMGMCLVYLLNKQTLKSLTVVEIEEDLVDFISPFFSHESRCKIIQDDAFNYSPPKGKTFDYVWHDIWTYQSVHNIKQIEKLKNKYKYNAKWQGAWREQKCIKQKELETSERNVIT